MQHHTHGHVYRNHKSADRVIQTFGNKPPQPIKEKIRQTLTQEKDRFLVLEQMRSRQPEQQRARGR